MTKNSDKTVLLKASYHYSVQLSKFEESLNRYTLCPINNTCTGIFLLGYSSNCDNCIVKFR